MPDLKENSRGREPSEPSGAPRLQRPTVEDGAAMWRLARDSRVLDLNTSYAYLLWARDFAATSVVAYAEDRAVGFVSGYLRPDEPTTLMVWQVAVDASQRGQGLGRRMLDHLAAETGAATLETTITADNEASVALFTSFGEAHGATVDRDPLFLEEMFPDEGHATEYLFRIGPLAR